MQHTFYQEGQRPITVKIRRDFITFHFKNQDDEEFYYILTDQWADPRYHWAEHMIRKNWFSEEMKKFIDDGIK
jgi:hypothetical protein